MRISAPALHRIADLMDTTVRSIISPWRRAKIPTSTLSRDNMGKFNHQTDNAIYQEIDGVCPEVVWSSPAYFNNTVYYGDRGRY